MKMKFGAIVVDGRNKIGGQVASKNRAGNYLRNKVTPVNRKTSAQTSVRSLLTSISQAWSSLTQNQRESWNNAVSNFKKSDIFGDILHPSGFNLFQRLNNNIMRLGGTMITVPPVVASLDSYTDASLTYTIGSPSMSLAFTAAAGEDSGYMILATPPVSAGKSFVKSEFRIIALGSHLAASPINILDSYTSTFGNVGNVGQKIFIQILPIGSISGLKGQPVQAYHIASV